MDKIKTLPKRRTSSLRKPISRKNAKQVKKNSKETIEFTLKEDANVKEYDPVKNLLDPNKMGAAIMQCLIENDPEGILEIVENHLYALNKTQFLKNAKIPRSTMYNFLRRKNPTIKTLAKLIHASYL